MDGKDPRKRGIIIIGAAPGITFWSAFFMM
jgi:hypothetical protein